MKIDFLVSRLNLESVFPFRRVFIPPGQTVYQTKAYADQANLKNRCASLNFDKNFFGSMYISFQDDYTNSPTAVMNENA